MLYLPEINNNVVEKQEAPSLASAKQDSVTPYSKHFQSAIQSNLREIQQEEEIIFWEPVKTFGVDQKEINITFNDFVAKPQKDQISDKENTIDQQGINETMMNIQATEPSYIPLLDMMTPQKGRGSIEALLIHQQISIPSCLALKNAEAQEEDADMEECSVSQITEEQQQVQIAQKEESILMTPKKQVQPQMDLGESMLVTPQQEADVRSVTEEAAVENNIADKIVNQSASDNQTELSLSVISYNEKPIDQEMMSQKSETR